MQDTTSYDALRWDGLRGWDYAVPVDGAAVP